MWSIELVGRRFAIFIALAGVSGGIVLSACSSEETPPPPGTLELVIAPESIELAPGATRHAQATITRGGSFTGDVGFTVSGNPAGVSVATGYLYAGFTTATVDVAVDATVAPGTSTVVISAVGDGPAAVTATATLTVVVVAASGSVSLAANPGTLTATAGATGVMATIALTRTAPFTGAVNLEVTGAPTGVTAALSPNSPLGDTSTLSVSAAPGTVSRTYTLVVRGTGTGIADAITFVNLTVTGGAAPRFALTFNPSSLAVTAGGASAASVLTLTPPFSRGLALYPSGAPAGLTVTLTRYLIRDSTTVTVQADGRVAPGTYILRFSGEETVGGIPMAAAALPVVVSAAPTLRR